jgi:hypothetical protein
VPTGQPAHAAAPEPQAEVLVPGRQTVPSQQPSGQEVEVQGWVWHCWPWQVVPTGQATQAAAPEPQAEVLVPERQTVPSQQPSGQVVEVHGWSAHCWPWQVAFTGQAVHAFPPEPQAAALVPARQTVPSQQPSGQLFAVQLSAERLHCLPWQNWPFGQAMHARPFAPQAALVDPERQLVPSQQPFGQVAALQPVDAAMQRLPWQRMPSGHRRQGLPPAPQAESVVPGRQSLPSQQPLAQVFGEQPEVFFRFAVPSEGTVAAAAARTAESAAARPRRLVMPAWSALSAASNRS